MFRRKKTTIEDVIEYLKTMNQNQIEALLEAVELYSEADEKKLEALSSFAGEAWQKAEIPELDFEN